MFYGMAQPEIDTTSEEVALAGSRFPCPSCGSMLRVGAILCPHCEADLWKLAHGVPEPPSEAVHPMGDGRSPTSILTDGRPVFLSVVIAAVALVAEIVLSLIARQHSFLLWAASAWGITVLAVYAIHLARQTVRRVNATGDNRGLIEARYTLILGVATIAYVATVFITSAIDHVISNL